MDNYNLENRIRNLQSRLKAENETNCDNLPSDVSAFCSNRHDNGSGRRPKLPLDMGTPTRQRKQLDLLVFTQPRYQENTEVDNKMKEIMKMNGILNINGKKYNTDIKDLEHLGELGNGTCGHVVKMLHKPSNTIIAVKQMRRSGNSDENKRIIMDLDVVFKSLACPYIVRYLGCFITESDVWICMELMATCFDRLLKKLQTAVPEDILGKVTLATVKALHYLKESHGIIHRDVKPSNILLDLKGNVKLCDFGISGRLVDSKAKTKNAGCAAYMAPERIEPPDPMKPDYDIRADVWSLGITLVELATGVFPYQDCNCDFEVLSRVLHDDPPSLPTDPSRFTTEFQNFVSSCLTKDYCNRPKYRKLLEHPFLKRYETKHVDVATWYARAVSSTNINSPMRFTPTSLSTSTRRQPPPPVIDHGRRSGLENIVANGDQSGRYSPLRTFDSHNGVDGLKLSEWDHHRLNGNRYGNCSPSPSLRRRFPPPEPPYANNNTNCLGSENTSPLVLQRFYHQQNQHLNNHLPSYPNSPSHYRSTSLSPSRRYLTESIKLFEESKVSEENLYDGGKKRYSSYLKFQLANTTNDMHRKSPPTVPSPAPPSPPPRLNRHSSNSSSPVNMQSSPLMMRRAGYYVYENQESPIASRRFFPENSPQISRRLITPPQPPPRRFSESSSVPGSPQHYNFRSRSDLMRNTPAPSKFQFTPQPQRKTIYQMNNL